MSLNKNNKPFLTNLLLRNDCYYDLKLYIVRLITKQNDSKKNGNTPLQGHILYSDLPCAYNKNAFAFIKILQTILILYYFIHKNSTSVYQ